MISVVIPVYNQINSLCKVLNAFETQNYNKKLYEIIVVDDGSTDGLKDISYFNIGKLNIKIIHQENKGRSAARNTGIKESKGDIIIFCDADRVPEVNFIKQHEKCYINGADIVIGASYDYFGRSDLMMINTETDWRAINKFSRLPTYFKNISRIYDKTGKTESKIVWLSFLVGNSSVKKGIIESVGGFDESYKEWGFEHFELAYRLYLKGYCFFMNEEAKSYHIPHLRAPNFYENAIILNSQKLTNKNPEIDEKVLTDFVKGKIKIDVAEKNIYRG